MNGAACAGVEQTVPKNKEEKNPRTSKFSAGVFGTCLQNSGRLEAKVETETEEWCALCSLGCRYCMPSCSKHQSCSWLNDTSWQWTLMNIVGHVEDVPYRVTGRVKTILHHSWLFTDVASGGSSTPGRGLAMLRPSGLVGTQSWCLSRWKRRSEGSVQNSEGRLHFSYAPASRSCFFDLWYIDKLLNLAIYDVTLGKDIFYMNLLAKSFCYSSCSRYYIYIYDIIHENTVVLRLWSFAHVDKKGF